MTWTTEMAADAVVHVATFGRSCTYRTVVQSTFASATGVRGVVTTDTALNMIPGKVNADRLFGGQSNKPREVRKFSVTAADLVTASITPQHSDRVVCDGVVWQIRDIERAMEGAMYELTCTRSA